MAYDNFVALFGSFVSFKNIDRRMCEKYADHLKKKYKDITAKTIFTKFRSCLLQAVRHGIIAVNPAAGITIAAADSDRQYLTLDELRLMMATPICQTGIKNAFLFSCWTGLRLSDIQALKPDQIRDGFLYYTQIKTGGVERIKLSDNALAILASHQPGKQRLFEMYSDKSYISRVVAGWAVLAGINKHITFHCARHTFATLCLTYDIDLYTVSKLLGHRDIKTTQIYAKLIDKKKDEAIDKLPKI